MDGWYHGWVISGDFQWCCFRMVVFHDVSYFMMCVSFCWLILFQNWPDTGNCCRVGFQRVIILELKAWAPRTCTWTCLLWLCNEDHVAEQDDDDNDYDDYDDDDDDDDDDYDYDYDYDDDICC